MMNDVDKRQQRSRTRIERIKRTALELFATHGADKVSMDEIAAKAHVSKVTIYKYFGSKEGLYSEVINLFMDDIFAVSEQVLNSDMDFLDKLKFLLFAKTSSLEWVHLAHFFQVWDADSPTAGSAREGVQGRVRALMYQFYEEGRNKGYIDEDISFDMLYLYADIFRTGFRAKMAELDSVLTDKQALDELLNLYFFGFVKRK